MRVRAKQYMYYQRREYQAGDEYDMDDREAQDAKLLATLGKIEIVDDAKPNTGRATPTYRTAAVKAEEPAPDDQAAKQDTHVAPMTLEGNPIADTGPRRYYRRRDMKADR